MTRYLLIVPTLALLGAAPAAQPNDGLTKPTRVVSPEPSVCRESGSFAQGDRARPNLRNLGELPPAQTYMAVYRTDEKGCLDPMLASERQGYRAPR
jgi:hypothetical protein